MLKTILTACVAVALGALGACSTASGPTFNAYAVDLPDGSQAYQVECHGLLESSRECVAVAQRVCHGQTVHVLDRVQALKQPGQPLTDPRAITFQCDQAQAEAQKAPEPAPAAVEVPQQVVLSADALFAFGHGDVSSISDEGRAQLDALAAKVRAAGDVQSLKVSGYADRLGSDAINARLSQQRAESVAQYLQHAGVTAKIDAHGYGKAVPGTVCDAKDRAALIQCLSPDRRVEIRFSGAESAAN
ncbi:OmpA family protein [Paraburkholderia strydomiana]|uniref:OmpA family protein n=1 Tax=Paraburkholderia strydomiana TaxID=1245417 RepID=UPI0038B98055